MECRSRHRKKGHAEVHDANETWPGKHHDDSRQRIDAIAERVKHQLWDGGVHHDVVYDYNGELLNHKSIILDCNDSCLASYYNKKPSCR